ncbi:MAG: type II toxin-antitoxin system RelE/ParE family toxin [Acidobacteria bacterium]|nr:type II toxin-antitoxin system RelE/ParE family toxin [Acidobacteriota bacterium]
MPSKPPPFRNVFTKPAQLDMADIVNYTMREFGVEASRRYRLLLKTAFREIRRNPRQPGVQRKEGVAPDLLLYHLSLCRQKARTSTGVVHSPRHFVVYRIHEEQRWIEVVRILHDSFDLAKHLTPG